MENQTLADNLPIQISIYIPIYIYIIYIYICSVEFNQTNAWPQREAAVGRCQTKKCSNIFPGRPVTIV